MNKGAAGWINNIVLRQIIFQIKITCILTKKFNQHFYLLPMFLTGLKAGCVTIVSIALPRFACGIKVTTIGTSHEPPVCSASRSKAILANAVRAPCIQVLDDIIEEDWSAITAHKVRLTLAGVWAPWHAPVGAAHFSVFFWSLIFITFTLKNRHFGGEVSL